MGSSLLFPDGKSVRQACRSGKWNRPTAGQAPGFVQANLVVLPRALAYDFLLFCQRNPKPCPLLEVTDPGCTEPASIAPDADLRTDLPAYCLFRSGKLEEVLNNLQLIWNDDWVSFLLGCSFTFENALLQAGLPVRHIDQGCNVPMYKTNIPCRHSGIFQGNMVVSMRPLTPVQALQASRITQRYPRAHGSPLHFGDPESIGIKALNEPDYGDPVRFLPGEIPVFWACGVTPQNVAISSKPPLLITHKPGHMFVSDLQDVLLDEG